MQQHGSKYFARIPLDPGGWSRKVIVHLFFSDYGHVAYQIKGYDTCSNMVTNILPADPISDPSNQAVGSRGQNSTFSEHCHDVYQILLESRLQQHGSNYFARRPPSTTLGAGIKSQNLTILEHGQDAYQIKGNDTSSNMVANF